MKTILILFSFLFVFNSKEQPLNVENRMITISFTSILKNSDNVVPLTITEIISGSERVGIVVGDYDGVSSWSICSRKIINNKITMRVFGINCKSFEKEYEVKNNVKLDIKLEYGDSKLKNRKDIELFMNNELGIPFCGTTSDLLIEEMENANYQHCDGRIKRFNEIPDHEKYQWDKIDN